MRADQLGLDQGVPARGAYEGKRLEDAGRKEHLSRSGTSASLTFERTCLSAGSWTRRGRILLRL